MDKKTYDRSTHQAAVEAFVEAATSEDSGSQVRQVRLLSAIFAAVSAGAIDEFVAHINAILGHKAEWVAYRASSAIATDGHGRAVLIAFVPSDEQPPGDDHMLDRTPPGARLFALNPYAQNAHCVQKVGMVGDRHYARLYDTFNEITEANAERLLRALVWVLQTHTHKARQEMIDAILTHIQPSLNLLERSELPARDCDRLLGLLIRTLTINEGFVGMMNRAMERAKILAAEATM